MTNNAQSDPWPPDARGHYAAPESPEPERSGHEPQDAIGSEKRLAIIDPAWLSEISHGLDQLRTLFDTHISEGEQQQQWITQLASQLAEYRNDFVFNNITSRIFRDLIQMYDTLGQTLDAAGYQGTTKEDIVGRLQGLHRQVLKILDRQGVEQIKSDARTWFDEAEQEAIDVRPVGRSENDGVVLESARCGFRYGTRLLRPESVIVGRYELEGREELD